MATKKRTVSFYQLSIQKIIGNHSKYCDSTEVKKHFDVLYSQMTSLSTEHRAKKVKRNTQDYVVEIIENGERYVYFKIGRATPTNTIGIRTQSQLEWEDIKLQDGKSLETYTYAMIDFETCIISFIGTVGAPNVNIIETFFKNKNPDVVASVASIIGDDVLDVLRKKDIITKTLIKVAVPSDEILRDIGVPRSEYDQLLGVKEVKKTFLLKGSRNKHMFTNESNLRSFIDTLFKKWGGDLETVKVSAKDSNHDESTQEYDLLDYKVTKSVSLNADGNHDNLLEDMFKDALKTTYIDTRGDLVKYIR